MCIVQVRTHANYLLIYATTPPDLKNFIESNLPKKKKKFVLGVSDSKLGGAIADTLDIKCSHIGVVPEIIRGIRFHFAKLVKGKYKVTSIIFMFSP